jgi:hypothetical protein
MNLLASPDLPAYWCYLLVLVVGMLVARSQVNRLLTAFPQRWGFLSTWGLFWAHAAVPAVLFWFLDYTTALRDTSLFAALVVAFGYRQIFAGGVESIRLPGQTQRLWQPFEKWVNDLVQHIIAVSRRYSERFDDSVRSYMAADAARIQRLLALAFSHTKQRAVLEGQMNALAAEANPSGVAPPDFEEMQNRKRVRLLLDDLRAAAPDNYGYFLYKKGVIPGWRYWLWFGNARSQAIAWAVTVGVFVGLSVGFYSAYQSDGLQARYHQWRFVKTNTSPRDHFRSREYLVRRLQLAGSNLAEGEARAPALMAPMLLLLRYKEVQAQVADDVLRLVLDSHKPEVNRVAVPQLIESLRTENADVRLRIQRTLLDLRQADYCSYALEKGTADWVPANDDSPGEIDGHVRAWKAWWTSSQQSPPSG